MAQTHDHEMVSIYPFTDEQRDALLNGSNECVLMWATKDGWPVGVTHAFTWDGEKIWLTFAVHRHRYTAMTRDPRVSVNVSSCGNPTGEGPHGAITIKGRAEFFDDDETKHWFYTELSRKLNPGNEAGEQFFYNLLDFPLRTVCCITPEKYIMYNADTAGAHMAGTAKPEDLGEPMDVDKERMNKAREERGLERRDEV